MDGGAKSEKKADRGHSPLELGSPGISTSTDLDCFLRKHKSHGDPDCFVKTIKVLRHNGSDEMARAMFDTGSTDDWISSTYATNRLNVTVKDLPDAHLVTSTDFNGRIVKPLGAVELIWYIPGQGPKTHKSQFYVSEQPHFDIIIGSRTISRENILIWSFATLWSNKKKLMPIPEGDRPKWSWKNPKSMFSYRSRRREFKAGVLRDDKLAEAEHKAKREDSRRCRENRDAELASQAQRASGTVDNSQHSDSRVQSLRTGKLKQQSSNQSELFQRSSLQLSLDRPNSDHDVEASTSRAIESAQQGNYDGPSHQVTTPRPRQAEDPQAGNLLSDNDFPSIPSQPVPSSEPERYAAARYPRPLAA